MTIIDSANKQIKHLMIGLSISGFAGDGDGAVGKFYSYCANQSYTKTGHTQCSPFEIRQFWRWAMAFHCHPARINVSS